MIEERAPSELGAYAGYFHAPQAELAVASIAEGNTRGRLWVAANRTGDDAALLWDQGNNVLYLSGLLASEGVVETLAALVAGPLRAQSLAEGRPYFAARPLTPQARALLSTVIHGIELHEVGKELYSCPRPASAPEPATEDLRVAPIDAELLARGDITGVDEVRDEVRQMWPSEELFLKRGMGLVALVGDRVACWCTTEYVSQRRCGIGIATHPEHRLRGIATFLAAQLAADWLRRGVTPYWDCRAENLASSRVARKAGFALVERFSMWAGRFEY